MDFWGRRRKLENLGHFIVSFAFSFSHCAMHCVWINCMVWERLWRHSLYLLLLAWTLNLFPGYFMMHQLLGGQGNRCCLWWSDASPEGFCWVLSVLSCLRLSPQLLGAVLSWPALRAYFVSDVGAKCSSWSSPFSSTAVPGGSYSYDSHIRDTEAERLVHGCVSGVRPE